MCHYRSTDDYQRSLVSATKQWSLVCLLERCECTQDNAFFTSLVPFEKFVSNICNTINVSLQKSDVTSVVSVRNLYVSFIREVTEWNQLNCVLTE